MDTALLDGDIIAWRAAVVIQGKEVDWDGDGQGTVIPVAPEAVAANVRGLVRNWTKSSGARKPLVCLSPRDGNTFRRHIIPGYKANRTGEKPEGFDVALETLESEYDVQRLDGVEADDVLGIFSTNPKLLGRTVIVTIDKDMQSIPGLYFRPGRDMPGKPRRITQTLADYFWMCQTLIGDPVDGYKGCPGIGKVKAQAALVDTQRTTNDMWDVVVKLFEEKGMSENEAITQARAARILRHGDYNQELGVIKLWHPYPNSQASVLRPPRSITLPLPSLPSTRLAPSQESRLPQRSSKKPATSGSSSRSR